MKLKALGCALLACWSIAAWAEEKKSSEPLFKDGNGFFTYLEPIDEEIQQDGKLKVVYFFNYDCKACIAADDHLKQYAERNPDKIILERYPFFNGGSPFSAKVHSTFEVLGMPELSDHYLFDSEGRKGERSLISNEKAIENWLINHNVDIVAFKNAFISEQTKQKVEQYIEIYKKYRPHTAPFVSVNGKYVLNYTTLYNDDYTFAVLDFLYEKEKKEK